MSVACFITRNVELRVGYCWYNFVDFCRWNYSRVSDCYQSYARTRKWYKMKTKWNNGQLIKIFVASVFSKDKNWVWKGENLSVNWAYTASNKVIPCQNLQSSRPWKHKYWDQQWDKRVSQWDTYILKQGNPSSKFEKYQTMKQE